MVPCGTLIGPILCGSAASRTTALLTMSDHNAREHVGHQSLVSTHRVYAPISKEMGELSE